MKRVSAGLVISIVGVAIALNASPQQPTNPQRLARAVEAALRRFLTAFENRAWEPFRASFHDDVTAFFPRPEPLQRFEGRAAVDAQFQQVFASIRTAAPSGPPFHRLVAEDLRIDQLGADAAVAAFHLRNEQRLARRTFVFRRTAGEWRIAHLHAPNVAPTPMLPGR